MGGHAAHPVDDGKGFRIGTGRLPASPRSGPSAWWHAASPLASRRRILGAAQRPESACPCSQRRRPPKRNAARSRRRIRAFTRPRNTQTAARRHIAGLLRNAVHIHLDGMIAVTGLHGIGPLFGLGERVAAAGRAANAIGGQSQDSSCRHGAMIEQTRSAQLAVLAAAAVVAAETCGGGIGRLLAGQAQPHPGHGQPAGLRNRFAALGAVGQSGPCGSRLRARSTASFTVASICSLTAPSPAQPVAMCPVPLRGGRILSDGAALTAQPGSLTWQPGVSMVIAMTLRISRRRPPVPCC